MFNTESLLHILFGFLLGVVTTIFLNIINKQPLQINKKLFISIVIYSLIVSSIAFLYSNAIFGGLLEDWHLLGKPESEHAMKVIDIGYVQTESGNIYRFSGLDYPIGHWERVNTVLPELELIDPGDDNCGTLLFLPRKRNAIDWKEACLAWGPGTIKVVYAVNKNGDVALWRHDLGELLEAEKFLFTLGFWSLACVISIFSIPLIHFFHTFKLLKDKPSLD